MNKPSSPENNGRIRLPLYQPREPQKRRPEPVVAAVIVDDLQRVLLALRERRPAAGYWHSPGGTVEFGEGHLDALRRECSEELGILIATDGVPRFVSSQLYPEVDRHVVAIYFKATVTAGTAEPLDGTTDILWATEAEARSFALRGILLEASRRAIEIIMGWSLPTPQ